MAESILSAAETPQTKDRRQAWGDMSAQSFDTPDDLYQATKPASIDGNFDYQEKVGMGSAFIKGLPKDETYKPTFGEVAASGLTDFIRSGVEVGAELFDPSVKAARQGIEDVRKYDPEFADKIERDGLGKKLTGTQLAVKGGAAVAEGALTFLPFFKVGRAALAVGEAATLAKAGKAGEIIGGSKILSKLYSGGVNGALYGGLYGLHEYDADWKEAAKGAAMGGTFGAGLMGLGSSLAFAGKYGGNKALQGFKFTSEATAGVRSKIAETLPAKWYSSIFSVESTLKKYYGDIGENFTTMFKQASKDATKDLGNIQLSLIDNGLMEAPTGLGKAFEGVQFVGSDTELMGKYNAILRGKGIYSDPIARTTAIESDARLQFLDGLRKTYGARSQQEGIVESLLDLDTYLPKHTPVVEMNMKTRSALSAATNQAEREAIFAANDPVIKEMVENSVFTEKAFKTLDDAYAAYYDYADIVGGGAHTPMGNNKFLQKMIAEGEAKTIEEARGKVLDDLKFRKKTLTPLAGSLDFKRKVNLPWYDPNPSRVMPQYVFDASMRIEMAKKFGANDEVLHQMLGSIKDDLSRGIKSEQAAKTFEQFVRQVTGQVMRSPGEEKASAFIRALQVPKLAFAQVINLGQSLNTLLASDLGSTVSGLTNAFRTENTRNAIERGVLLNNFIREVFNYNSGGAKTAENILKYSGFTYTEMFNRVVGSTAADFWGAKNLDSLFKKYGLTGIAEDEQKNIGKMLANKAKLEKESLLGGVKVQQELFDEFRRLFPDENFTAAAGNLGAAKKRLGTLENSIGEKVDKLQKTRALLEKELLSESEPLTTAQTADLREIIDSLRGEIRTAEGVNIGKAEAEPIKQYSQEQIEKALDGVTQLKRAKLEDIIARLETKFDEVRAEGTMPRDIVTMHGEAAKSEESLGNYVARVQDEISGVDSAIIGLQNELADKSRILEGAVDSYQISAKRAADKIPEGAAYDEFVSKRKMEMGDVIERITKENSREYWALKELDLPVEDIVARGYMTPEEKAIASQTFVERTQFLGRPIDLPYFASTPVGKVMFQFKTFAYQQARFVTKEMKGSFSRGDYSRVARNLLVLGTVFPMTGEVLADVRSLITQEKRPTKAFDRYIADIFAAGTYGMFYDFYKSSESGKLAENVLGPTIGDAIRYLETIPQTINNPETGLKNFTKQILRQTGVGRVGVNVVFPSKSNKGESSLESLMEWAADE